tara:strand:- start:4806 stop:6458 length:1653 start_codon:yes stop_codon:yes gene_type:complete
MPIETEVLIVGAGPCGLILANELGRRGVSAYVVDRESTVAMAPQANATQARTMEHYRRLGFAHEIRAMGMPADHPTDVAYFTRYNSHELARFEMPSSSQAHQRVKELAHVWNAAELPHRIPQSLVEQTLLRKARELDSIRIDFLHELVTFSQTDDGVNATIKDLQTGECKEVHALYMFGADGGNSVVRRTLGIEYTGGDLTSRDFMGGQMLSIYISAPAFYDLGIKPAWMYWAVNRQRRALLATVDGKGMFALQTQLKPEEKLEDITDERASELFCQAIGQKIDHEIIGRASWMAGRALVAERFQDKRVLLGGDAVHLFTPTGGMGYNTAVEDAVNIGWKLAAVIKNNAPKELLESYEQERKPIAHRNTEFALRFADSIGLYQAPSAIEKDDEAGDFARKRAGAYIQQHAEKEFTIPGFTLGARYDASRIIHKEPGMSPPDAPSVYVPTAKPGGRAPHLWLKDGESLYDCFGFNWTLLSLDTNLTVPNEIMAFAEKNGMDLTLLVIEDEPLLNDLYERKYMLIRPDQVVAWRGDDLPSNHDVIFKQLLGG